MDTIRSFSLIRNFFRNKSQVQKHFFKLPKSIVFAQWIAFKEFGINLCLVSTKDSFEHIYVALGTAASEKQDRASGFNDLFIQFNDYILVFNVNVKLITLNPYIY